jgi:hypothetical protein
MPKLNQKLTLFCTVFILVLIPTFLFCAGCGPNLSGFGDLGRSLNESLNTKYVDVKGDFWSKVDGKYINSEKSSLSFDRATYGIEISTQSGQIRREVTKKVKTCPKGSSDWCFCDEGSCEYTDYKTLPCSSHVGGVVSGVKRIKDPFGFQSGNLVTFSIKTLELSYSNKSVELAKAKKNGSLVEQLKAHCEALLLGGKINEDISINLTKYSSDQVVWSSGNIFDLVLDGQDNTKTFTHQSESQSSQ